MRVCMFAMLLPAHYTGGMEIHSLDLARGISKAGHEVVVITSRHPDRLEREVIDGVEIYYTDVRPTSRTPLGGKSLRKFEELHSEKRFDVIHSQSFSAYYYVKDGWKKRLKVPLVTTMHGTGFSEVRSNLNQGPSLMLLPKVAFQLLNHYLRMKPYLRESDAVIAISKELQERIPREFGISPAKVKTVYNGVDTEEFKPGKGDIRDRFKGKKVIFTASALHKQKGVQYLIKAMAKIVENPPETVLLVGGDGPYRKELDRLTAKLGLSCNVSFEGKIPHDRLADYYGAADVFVIPTIRVEGLPLVELESMACGRPVVASNIGGIPTVIKDGENGILVEPGNVQELAESISAVLQDPALSSRLATSARKTIMGGFSREKMIAGTVRVYGEVMG